MPLVRLGILKVCPVEPIQDLENRIRESHSLVCEYMRLRQTSDDPQANLRYERQIDEQWSLIYGYLKDYLGRIDVLGLTVPADIRQIAARFPDLALRAESTDIEFVNREQELDRLSPDRLRASRSPYTLIGAPAGYGKSYLLKRLMARVQSSDATAQAWNCRYVDLSYAGEEPTAWIAQALIGRPEQDVQALTTQIIQTLSTPWAGGRRAVLLLFDTVERLNAQAAQWLYELFHTLHVRTRIGGREIVVVRIVVAGRSIETFWAGYERAFPSMLAPQRLLLTSFDAYPIQELVWSRAQRAQVLLDDQIVTEIVREVQHLSGGHPAIIRALVDHLTEQAFAIGAVDRYFDDQRATLVHTCVEPIAEALLADLPPHMRMAVQTLSIFRRFNANTIRRLICAGELPADVDEIDLIGTLQRAHIVLGPTIQEPFYRDHLMRRVLAIAMASTSDECAAYYRRLNMLALNLYAGWIRGEDLIDSHLKSTQRLYSLLEWLFHALQTWAMPIDELCRTLRGHIQSLSGNGDDIAPLIADQIRRDDEICYLIRRQFGDAGLNIVCDALCVCPEEGNEQI